VLFRSPLLVIVVIIKSNMFLYSLTLNQATAIQHSVIGSFTEADQQEIVVAKGKILELLRPDESTGTLQLIYR